MTRRVVLDTNVIVAALRSRNGASFALVEAIGTSAFVHCLSVPLLFEYEDALKRPAAVPFASTAVDAILDYICAAADRRSVYFLWRPQLPDAGDDLVLELAVAGQCDTIITFNQRDFVGADRFGIRIQPPAAFLSELRLEGVL